MYLFFGIIYTPVVLAVFMLQSAMVAEVAIVLMSQWRYCSNSAKTTMALKLQR